MEFKICTPKEFWKYFASSKNNDASMFPLVDFYAYFSNLENDIFKTYNNESELFCNTSNCDFDSSFIDTVFQTPY